METETEKSLALKGLSESQRSNIALICNNLRSLHVPENSVRLFMELSSSPIMQVKELPAKRGVQFIDLKQSNNRVIASALTNLFLINYLDFINAKVSMSDEQCIDTVEIIIDEYPYMTTDSIKTFFRQCKMGRFGEVYGSIDGAKILSWLRKFNEDLDRSIDNYEYQQHVNSINNTNTDNLLSQILRVS